MISVLMEDADGVEWEVILPSKWIICDACAGHGKSSAHLGAFTASDMDEEGPEFMDDYMAGHYDRPCDVCKGTGKLQVPDEEHCTQPEQRAALEYMEEREREAYDERRTRRYEDGDYSY